MNTTDDDVGNITPEEAFARLSPLKQRQVEYTVDVMLDIADKLAKKGIYIGNNKERNSSNPVHPN